MGWGNCGTDSKGRPIGYSFGATCDHKGCKAKIDRGLGYACGGMHGENGYDCEGYFCGDHMVFRYCPDDDRGHQVCFDCAMTLDGVKAEEFQDLILHAINVLNVQGGGKAREERIDKLRKEMFELVMRWDEFDELPADERFLSERDLEKVRERQVHRRAIQEMVLQSHAES
jgi:hypothetical protein